MRRDTHEKAFVPLEGLADTVADLLKAIQKNMLEKSRALRDSRVSEAHSVAEILDGVERGHFVKAAWCGCRACEDKIKEETAASARVIAEGEQVDTVCAVCGKPAEHTVYFARAY